MKRINLCLLVFLCVLISRVYADTQTQVSSSGLGNYSINMHASLGPNDIDHVGGPITIKKGMGIGLGYNGRDPQYFMVFYSGQDANNGQYPIKIVDHHNPSCGEKILYISDNTIYECNAQKYYFSLNETASDEDSVTFNFYYKPS